MSKNFTKLSAGVLSRMGAGEDVPCPIFLQILGSKRIPASSSGGQDRYRLVLSDGVTTHNFAMLATTLNAAYEQGKFSEYTIVKVDRFVPSRVNRADSNERQVLILFEVEILHSGEEVGRKIDSPAPVASEKNVASGSSNQAQKENLNTNSRFMPTSSSAQNQSMNTSLNNSSMFGGNLSEHLTMPIESLSPYQNKWVIKARVVNKSAIRSWSNAKGEGKLFSMDLVDETGEIRCTGFRDMVEKYYEYLEVDKVYYISRCQLKPANKQYNTMRNDYEMTMGSETQIQLCQEEGGSIPQVQYNFIPISEIAEKNKDDFVDVIGICKEASPVVKFVSRASNRELTKREVTLIDQSNSSIVLTLWGNEAENFNDFDNPVVMIRNARLGEFGGGKTLGTVGSTTMKINPDDPNGHKLRGWFDNGGANQDFAQLSLRTQGNLTTEWVTFHETKLKNLGADKPAYFQTFAMIHNIRSDNMLYKACPNNECNKKVIEQDGGQFRCEKCNITTNNYKYRLLVNMLIGDWTSNRWVTFFSEVAEKVLGRKTDDIAEMMNNNKQAFDEFIQDALFKPAPFKLRSKIETYGDVPRSKISALAVNETKVTDYNRHLLNNICRLTGISEVESTK